MSLCAVVQCSPLAVCFTPLQSMPGPVHSDLRLVCTCLAMETHDAPNAQSLCWYCYQRQTAGSDATKDMWFLRAILFRTQQPCSVSICGLPHQGCTAVAPRCFHFTIIAVTVDQDRYSTAEISQTDLWTQMASYGSAMFTEFLRITHSASVCLWRVHGYLIDFMHILAMGVAETLNSMDRRGVHILLAI